MATIERIGNVFFEVEDLNRSVNFYKDVLGLQLKFRDGDRWVAFDVGGTTLAIAPKSSGAGRRGATVSLRTGDVDAWANEAVGRGLKETPITTGPHERSVELSDPDGNPIIVYSPHSAKGPVA